MRSIFKYLISLMLSSSVLLVVGQSNEQSTPDAPLFNGFRLDIDVLPLLTTIFPGDALTYEAAIQANLRNKYYPVFEMGFASSQKTSTDNLYFSGNGVFTRLGLDFRLLKAKENQQTFLNNLLTGGVRLGFTHFEYDLENAIVHDSYWNETLTLNFYDQKADKVWIEFVAGIRVEIFKNVLMGWNVRSKRILGTTDTGTLQPWYIPGFGRSSTTTIWGFNYVIGYKF